MSYIIPSILLLIFLTAIKNKTPAYNDFCDGVGEGLKTLFNIFPVLLLVTCSVSMMRASGLFDILTNLISPVTSLINLPEEVVPLALLRPISGSGSLGILSDILKNNSPDSRAGIIACVIMGSCETTFYTLMVYFKNTRVKYNKHIIPAAIFGDIVAVLAGVWASTIIF